MCMLQMRVLVPLAVSILVWNRAQGSHALTASCESVALCHVSQRGGALRGDVQLLELMVG